MNVVNRFCKSIMVIAGICISLSAQATTYNFGLPLNNNSAYPTPSGVFATMNVSDLGANTYRFLLSTGDLNSIFYQGAYISDLLINTPSSITTANLVSGSLLSGSTINALATNTVQSVALGSTSQSTGNISWNFDTSYPNSGASGGSRRLTAFEWVQWDARFNTALVLDDPAFGLHVNAMDAQGNSAWYEPGTPSPVPVPAAAWLFGSALIGFISMSNRRKV